MRMIALVTALIFLMQPAFAVDASFETSVDACKKDSTACDTLAVEISKSDFRRLIDASIDAKRGTAGLCPADNPNCCPEELAPFCSQIASDQIETARRRYIGSTEVNTCPYSRDVCDVLGDLYCGPDSVYLPWGVCSTNVTVEPTCPFGWVWNGGTCAPPFCGPNERWNGKICVPKKCTFKGFIIPCGIFDGPNLTTALRSAPSGKGKLSTKLQDPQIQTRAYRELRSDYEAAINALDALIENEAEYE